MSDEMTTPISIVFLTFNRPQELLKTITALDEELFRLCEIIVVDNASEQAAAQVLSEYPSVKVLTMDKNLGVSARNNGIAEASGELVITLDDDVRGITADEVHYILRTFSENEHLVAMNFKVLEEETGRQINWCHHRKMEDWADTSFETYEISEGAVVLRKAAVELAGYYPDNYFISHEGPDLALRLMNLGGFVIYDQNVQVFHARSPVARVSWRRYYFDTRNLIWMVYKYYSFSKGFKKLFFGLGSLFVYAIRDGFVRYWFKAVYDAMAGLRLNERQRIRPSTWDRIERLESFNPSFAYMVKKRLGGESVDI